MPDSDIDFSEIRELDRELFRRSVARMPRRKQSVSIRLDPEVLDWFKRQGRGYQTRMNAVLRSYVEAHQR